MGDFREIKDLKSSSNSQNEDLFLVSQNNITKKISKEILFKETEEKISVLDSQIKDKANKTTTDNIQQQVNNLVLGAVGDGNNAEVIQARGKFNILNDRFDNIDNNKTSNLVSYINGNEIISNDDVIVINESISYGDRDSLHEINLVSGFTYNMFIKTNFYNVKGVWEISCLNSNNEVVKFLKTNIFEFKQSKKYYMLSFTLEQDVSKLKVLSKVTNDSFYEISIIKNDLINECNKNYNNLLNSLTTSNISEILITDIYNCGMDASGILVDGTSIVTNNITLKKGCYEINVNDEYEVVYNKNSTSTVVKNFPFYLEINNDTNIRFMIRRKDKQNMTSQYFIDSNFSIIPILKQKKLIKLNVEFENGLFNGSGTNVDATNHIRVSEYISTNKPNKFLFVYIKNGYELIINNVNPITNYKENKVLYNHFSIIPYNEKIRIGARKHDRSEITDAYDDIIKIYSLEVCEHESFDITIAANNSEKRFKGKADIVCDGINDQFIIQCAINNLTGSNKVLMYPGDYYINEIRDFPNNYEGLFGKKGVFSLFSTYANNKKTLYLEGYTRSIIQSETKHATTIRFTKECWDSINESENQISVIGGEYNNFFLHNCMQIKNINLRGFDSKKPIVYVDGYYFANMMIDKVNVSNTQTPFSSFDYMPNYNNIGFRGLQGSPYGTNYIKNCLAWKCGVGYSIGGEHFVLEDCATAFSRLGFAFSDYDGRTKMEHNIIMLKCVISQCMESIRFNRYGLDEGSEDERVNTFQNIECFGLQFESDFTTLGLELHGYEDGKHSTKGFYEVHDNKSWRGIITLQYMDVPVERGCLGLKITVLSHKFAGSLNEIPSVNNALNYEEFYDTENNQKYIFFDGQWKKI